MRSTIAVGIENELDRKSVSMGLRDDQETKRNIIKDKQQANENNPITRNKHNHKSTIKISQRPNQTAEDRREAREERTRWSPWKQKKDVYRTGVTHTIHSIIKRKSRQNKDKSNKTERDKREESCPKTHR